MLEIKFISETVRIIIMYHINYFQDGEVDMNQEIFIDTIDSQHSTPKSNKVCIINFIETYIILLLVYSLMQFLEGPLWQAVQS